MEEEELYEIIGMTKDLAFPYKWVPDKPLDYYKQGPYPMKWPEDE